ncbi:GH36-type glycosyl hydrolase domain-containing protein [Massilia sp. PWRC2]|uniref:GH36-type glycosyl hydrolase domain-containing protein n=1 Tax=Massilia sp. PWRC2 TaxID=2804626 RepID=UPI003CEFD957
MNHESFTLSDTRFPWQNGAANSVDGGVAADELPLRSELFSAAQMAAHGGHLAARHQLSKKGGPDRLLSRLTENAEVIAATCDELTAAIKAGRQITPASEWLLDNFYLIEEQIRTARRHLPKNYSKELPRLANEDAENNPRVYQIALEIIAHGDGRVDPESLSRFVDAYQEIAPLKLGELWAIPIMLRLALLENLRRVAARVYDNRSQRDRANSWADQMSATAEKTPSELILLVADMARSRQPMSSGFVAELARRLQGQNSALAVALQWVTTRLADAGLTIEQQIQTEIQQQAADQVTISNSIGSLRFLGTMDWREFVETMSAVESTLRLDPADTYGKMDFATRDNYRHAIERLAKRAGMAETAVAATVLQMAQTAHDSAAQQGGASGDLRRSHVGYYLIGNALPLLEKRLQTRQPVVEVLDKAGRAAPLASYLGAIGAFTVLFAGSVTLYAWRGGLDGVLLVLLALFAAIGASQLALALVNFMATQLTRPHPLPRMDFKAGLPDHAHAIVVVPTMLYSHANIASLVEDLEVRYLANRDPGLRFCLLTDFADAASETMPNDADLLALAGAAIEQLNGKYRLEPADSPLGVPMLDGVADPGQPITPFLLLHRPRRWNAAERAWMGQERKRGKLGDFNSFLRGGARERFSLVVGDTCGLETVRYVITLDTDTQLPRDAARQFVATMAHPLNQPLLNSAGTRVVEGYGILQPRVTASLPSENASRYERLCGGEPGIDPYTRTVSDVYQDVFYEGSFVGKGIYDVDMFEHLLAQRFPDNQILSHDLLEGNYLRAGLLSDAQLYEAYPARYSDDVKRRHRWIRGDWQLIGWLLPSVPAAHGREKNPLSALSRWKLFDNLRRSVVAPVLTALLLIAWALLPSPVFWTGAVLAVIFLPTFVNALFGLIEKPHDIGWNQHLQSGLPSLRAMFGHAFLQTAFLPYEAWVNTDAIARTCWRMAVSRRRLLEWQPSAQAQSSTALDASWRRMWFGPAAAIGAALMVSFANPPALFAAAPVLLLWFLSPIIAWWISLPMPRRQAQLQAGQTVFLQSLGRRTWGFFEDFVGAADNYLPPDNMQEHPTLAVAHRTSPTNIGMSLLANLSAYDFGFATAGQALTRVARTFDTMDRMERHHGHFYNWYDTQSLAPLLPMYVSAVDSGNLAGHLLTLAPGINALADQPIASTRSLEGVAITLRLLLEVAGDAHAALGAAPLAGTLITSSASAAAVSAASAATASAAVVVDAVSAMQALLADGQRHPDTLPGLTDSFVQLADAACALSASVAAAPEHDTVLAAWCEKLAVQCRAARDELFELAPWMRAEKEYVVDSRLTRIPTLRELANFSLVSATVSDLAPAERTRQHALTQLVAEGSVCARRKLADIAELAARARAFAQMEFGFLYNSTTNLMAIGYNVSDRRLDASCYDLLASEARLASFVGIAQGQFPQEHWFALGRQLCIVGGEQLLLSWSGSMFEYLMPLLVMPTYPDTLLDQTYRAIIKTQIEYGRQRGTPWGISESGYNTVDANLNYQYRAFGVPGTGMKRGLADDLVIAPYATMMGLMVDAEAATDNLQRMAALGFMGNYGFYEAIDYTTARLPRGQDFAVVRSFMAHHQGMGFLALSYLLHDRPMQKRFDADPLFQATMLVLQERVPKAGAFQSHTADLAAVRTPSSDSSMPMRIIGQTSTPQPEVQLLSNGRYHVMVTSSGGSYSRWKDLAVTRWREDATTDNWGNFCYVRDVDSGAFWSTTYQPTLVEPKKYEVIFSEGRAEFRRQDRGLELYTEIVVSPEDDIEMRRTRITNKSALRRTIEVTSYAEVVMAPAAADNAHPAFSKLFVQTEILRNENAILCTRRPRSKGEHMPYMLNLMTVHDGVLLDASFETSRADFIGRANSTVAPCAMLEAGALKGAEGSVLDPIVAIRYMLTLQPDQQVILDVVTGMTETREAALHLIDKYQDRHLADRVFELAWTHSQVVLRQLNATEADAQLYSRLASAVIYPNASLRADPSVLIRNHRGQSGLWAYAISGDLPIVLMQINNPANIDLARQMVQAHAYWRLKGLVVDLVIWYEDQSGYRQALHDQIMGLIASGIDAQAIDRPGGIFVRLLDQISPEDRVLMQSVARAILTDSKGTLAEQIKRAAASFPKLPPGVFDARGESYELRPAAQLLAAAPPLALILDNGTGGFTADGSEYVIHTDHANRTPAPWVNVLANPSFGSVVSESGQAYTWSENAHEFRLTPWDNDPVADSGGEAFYIRDEATGTFWSPTALPVQGSGSFTTRHGFGYSVFEHQREAIHSTLTTFVALDAPIKYAVIKLRNDSTVPRKLSVTGYVEWVLGDLRSKSAMHVVTEQDPQSGALFARNAYNTEFSGRVGFFQVEAQNRTVTADRNEFVGRNRSLARPAAMLRARLSGKLGAALDPCAAIQVQLELQPGQERELVYMLGVGGRRNADASGLVQKYHGSVAAAAAFELVRQHWQRVLGAVRIATPEPQLDVLANGWLMYQTIACRMWARSGYYQSGGAFGFRDQLQDAMAMIHTQPHILREHLILCAAHQFVEGDVQHWWHPPTDRGVRTHCSDDYLWLPLAAHRYVTSTGDTGVLDQQAPFLEGRMLAQDEESYYDMFGHTHQTASLYEHCVRAIRRGLRFGEHGLPLIGTCDWNDGMDRVGNEGRGESVWLAWFLFDVLTKFAHVADLRGDAVFAESCRAEAKQLAANVEQHAWDGQWYRRAYFDDGTPLGSHTNDECQIDSISQSWGVLSGAADPARVVSAMAQVDARLVRRHYGLVQLLDPPFDKGVLNPGYIRGYVPGVRENGGQYTHAAIWTAMAFAKMGDSDKAWELLRMINPVQHGSSAASAALYKVEPYVVAADVYAVAPHIGRGGWSWYTGSSGWMYRLMIESLLGLDLAIDKLTVAPSLPAEWDGFSMHYQYRTASYAIAVSSGPQASLTVDGRQVDGNVITLVDDGGTHAVTLVVAKP